MKASELRIGNWVEKSFNNDIYHKKEYQIKGHDLNDFYLGTFTYSPIPLTEEWLLKLSFETDENIIFIISDIAVSRDEPNGNYWSVALFTGFMPFRLNGKTTNNKPIQYVHQLQNLYFALTGEELTIKEHAESKPNN